MRVLLVHNPRSGDDDHGRGHLVEVMTRAGHDVSYHQSKSEWRAELDARPDLIVVAGGDGTVAEVARVTAGHGVPLTVLPTGTANNIASWLGLSGIPLEALIAGWTQGSLQPFDLGVARGPWDTYHFLESIGVGLLAGLMSEIDAGGAGHVNELDGRAVRIAAALDVLERVLRDAKPIACEVQLDDVHVSGEYLLVEILNFGLAGPNLRLAPEADAADGILDVVMIEARERDRLEEHLALVRTDPVNAPTLPVRHARRVTLRCQPCAAHLDDELWPGPGERSSFVAEVNVVPAALTFLVPSGAASSREGGGAHPSRR